MTSEGAGGRMAEIGVDGRLGRVEGKLDLLLASQQDDARKAAESRARLYSKVEDVDRKMHSLSSDQAAISRRLTDIETTLEKRVLPVIERAEKLEQRALGARWAGGHAWRAGHWLIVTVATGLVMFWREILAFLRGG